MRIPVQTDISELFDWKLSCDLWPVDCFEKGKDVWGCKLKKTLLLSSFISGITGRLVTGRLLPHCNDSWVCAAITCVIYLSIEFSYVACFFLKGNSKWRFCHYVGMQCTKTAQTRWNISCFYFVI